MTKLAGLTSEQIKGVGINFLPLLIELERGSAS